MCVYILTGLSSPLQVVLIMGLYMLLVRDTQHQMAVTHGMKSSLIFSTGGKICIFSFSVCMRSGVPVCTRRACVEGQLTHIDMHCGFLWSVVPFDLLQRHVKLAT